MKFPEVLLVSRCYLVRNGKVLLLHRAKEREYNINKWELPGGKVELNQGISEATEEEILEETGLLVKISSPTVFTEAKMVSGGKYDGMLYLELVNEARIVSGRVRLGVDHSEYKWVKPDEALSMNLSIEARKAITFFSGGVSEEE